MEVKELIQSLRKNAQGKTCLGTGNYALDIIIKREYPNGFIKGKRNKFIEHILFQEIGNTCGNVMTMLPYLGVKTYPMAQFDQSPQGYQLKKDLKRYGADVRFVSMYLHGSASAGYSRTSIGILKYLPEDWQLLTPDCPADANECMSMLRELCEREKPDIIIGCSQGGFYAHQLSGYKRICINPALDLSKDADIKIGKHNFIINRQDGIQSYTITPEMHQAYQKMEAHQFDHVTDFDRENCHGLFGEQDTDWGYCKDIFGQYYKHISSFPGGHKMEHDEIETYLMPLIKRIIG